MRIARLAIMFLDAGVLIDIIFQHLDSTAAGRVSAALVLLVAVIGSWGTFENVDG
jgi:hypothetical protein